MTAEFVSAEFVTDESQVGTRIDVAISRAAQTSRAHVTDSAKTVPILLNGRPVKPSAILELGDTVVYALEDRPPLEAKAQAIPLDVVFEDDVILVVNKPVGMVTHPAHGTRENTLVNALLSHVGELPGEPLRAGLIHRLDRDTSGLLLIAKTPEALSKLGIAMQRRYIEREYLGLVMGAPEEDAGVLEGPIGRDPQNRMRYAVTSDGKPAVTHFRTIERLRGVTELAFKLETGRTHQIRVHTAAFGYPILNDVIYGRRDSRIGLPGQALHARRLAFRHPVSFLPLEFEVAPPQAYLEAKEFFR